MSTDNTKIYSQCVNQAEKTAEKTGEDRRKKFFFPICFHIDKSKPLYYNTDSVNVCVLREKHAKPEDHNTFV